ncbi:hypothetical protein JCM14469_34470 [Desulfatiferula olefinivorans]
MKQRAILWVAVCVVPVLIWGGAAGAEPIRIITFAYPPYMVGDGSGLFEKAFDHMARETGTAVIFEVYPRKRALSTFAMPENGLMFLGEREYFPDLEPEMAFLKLLDIHTVFVYLKDRFPDMTYRDYRDLSGKRVGISMGSIYTSAFKAAGLVVDEAKLPNNLLKLKNHRIDFWHTVDSAATLLIARMDPGFGRHYAFLPDQTHMVELMVKKNSPARGDFETLVRGFRIITDNGTFQTLIESIQ